MRVRKCGVVFYRDNGDVVLIKPSDPNYGGPDFQLPKGEQKEGESTLDTAIREGCEETGINKYNIQKFCYIGCFPNKSYDLHMYACYVGDNIYGKPDYEVSEVKWFNKDKALEIVRKDHREVLEVFINEMDLIYQYNNK